MKYLDLCSSLKINASLSHNKYDGKSGIGALKLIISYGFNHLGSIAWVKVERYGVSDYLKISRVKPEILEIF